MRLTRREMIKLGLIGGGAVALPVGRAIAQLAGSVIEENFVESPPVASFKVPLAIPPVLRPASSNATTDFYEITQRVAQVQIIPGLPRTSIWGYNGITPGPTIKQQEGRAAVVRQINRLPVEVSVHRHGGAQPADSDGHPLDLIEPGDAKSYFYPAFVQEAATIWYHDHAIHETGRNVWRGLAGFYLLFDEHERSLPLPKGRFDIPLAIQDRFFLRNGQIPYPLHDVEENRPVQQGAFGDVILVNGTPKPFLRVLRRKYRFRTLNGSNARVYRLALSTGDPFTVIATDDGLLNRPVETEDLVTSPAERYEIVIDFSRYRVGTKVILKNRFEDIPGDPVDEEKTRDVMRFEVIDDARDPSSVPRDLNDVPDPDPSAAVRTRNWVFARNGGQWTINEKPFDEDRIDARPRQQDLEIWRFVNQGGGWFHPIHPHGGDFRILSIERREIRPYERGPKDTVFLGSNEVARVLLRFHPFKGVFAYHCHNIEHEDDDMMTQYEIV
jgi:FtsP/CotA-like multicopper oxidase with cupredoxin domain